MSRQENYFEGREKLGMTNGFVNGRKVLAVLLAVMIGASFVFTAGVSAHNIDLAKARELVRDYARIVRSESNGRYLHYKTTCVRAYPNHNHYVRCVVEYQDAKDTAAGVYTCRESVEVFHSAHSSSGEISYELAGRHTSSNRCGGNRIFNTPR